MSSADAKSKDDSRVGPMSFLNFRAHAAGRPRTAVVEVPLYSDARIVGDVSDGLGPCELLNPLRMIEGTLDTALVLRVGIYMVDYPPEGWSSKADLRGYSGTSFADEIACLISLELGARVASGGVTREFTEGGDPLGRPRNDFARPALPVGDGRAAVLPFVRREKNVATHLRLLPRLAELTPDRAICLLRAARAYRDAIWLGEAEPQLSWLLMLSALETAAVEVALPKKADAEARLRDVAPALAGELDAIGKGVTAAVADHMAHLLKAQARFLALFERFPPNPPQVRPSHGFRFRPWDAEHLRVALTAVYDWRSKALHGAIPFPPPMCEAPMPAMTGDPAPCETVPGLAAYALGGTWTREQMPFGLHLFEHLTRATLLSWWASLLPETAV